MTSVDPLLMAGGVWLWESYGKDAFSWLVKRMGKRAEELKHAGWEKIDWARASRTYREELVQQHGSMHIFGMTEAVPLSNIFTDVYLLDKPSAWRRHAIEELRAHAQTQADYQSKEQRHNGVALVQKQKRLFILGQPGAGKTTFLKYLVTQAVQGTFDAIPIFVELKAWSAAQIDLLPFLVRQFAMCGFPDAQPFVEHILDEGQAIVLFDGLDEVNLEGGARERITGAIRDFARQYRKSRVVITCRTAATDYVFEKFTYCELADFTQEQIQTFVGRWFQTDAVKHEAFLKAFEQPDHERLRDLARRPLLLTMLCLTFEETMAFPRRRAELYEEAIDALLKRWDISRSIQRDTIYRKLSLGYKRQLLMELAAETFERGELFMRQSELVERIVRFLRRLPPVDITEDIDGEVVLRAIEAQHGLLVERARGIYSFSHLTFHEYFTARYIADHPEPAVLRGAVAHAADPHWREVLLLTASMLDYHNVARLFRLWCEYLQQEIQNDSELTTFMQWTARQAQAAGVSANSSVRAGVMSMILIDYGVTCALDYVRASASDLARALDRDRALILARDFAHAHDRDRDRDRDHALDLVFDQARALVRDRDRGLDRALALGRDFARAHGRDRDLSPRALFPRAFARALFHDRVLVLAGDLAHILNRIHSRTSIHSPEDVSINSIFATNPYLLRISWWYRVLHYADYLAVCSPITWSDTTTSMYEDLIDALNQLYRSPIDATFVQEFHVMVPATTTADPAAWTAFATAARTLLIQHRDIGHRWQFTGTQLDLLQNYLVSTERLLDCLDLATVEDREAILNCLLLPPEQPTAVETAEAQPE